METKPALVSFGTKQAGECEMRKYGAEPCVWSDRMLTALENGVKGGTWFSLIDKVSLMINLQVSYEKVRRNHGAAGVDHITIDAFGKRLEKNLQVMQKQLEEGTYQPQTIRRKLIPEAGKKNEYRPLGIPTVRDRVVQTALRNAIEPIFEKEFAEQSYGFRPKRGCKDALRRVDALLKQGYHYVKLLKLLWLKI
jgi:RNA-directed DNA polymerase